MADLAYRVLEMGSVQMFPIHLNYNEIPPASFPKECYSTEIGGEFSSV
jgi:hypothetical protein